MVCVVRGEFGAHAAVARILLQTYVVDELVGSSALHVCFGLLLGVRCVGLCTKMWLYLDAICAVYLGTRVHEHRQRQTALT
jgi:hypothetical protein